MPLPLPGVVKILPDGRESVVSIREGDVCVLDDVSNDGQWLACRGDRGRQLVAKRLAGENQVIEIRKAPVGTTDQSRFSPDDHLIAYNADETGRFEVYVKAFAATGERWPISNDGGVQPVWRADGRELYYLGLDGVLNAVAVRPGARPSFSIPRRVFDTGLAEPSPWVEQYTVSADGRRFLIFRPANTKVRNSMGVILNWQALIQAGRIDK